MKRRWGLGNWHFKPTSLVMLALLFQKRLRTIRTQAVLATARSFVADSRASLTVTDVADNAQLWEVGVCLFRTPFIRNYCCVTILLAMNERSISTAFSTISRPERSTVYLVRTPVIMN